MEKNITQYYCDVCDQEIIINDANTLKDVFGNVYHLCKTHECYRKCDRCKKYFSEEQLGRFSTLLWEYWDTVFNCKSCAISNYNELLRYANNEMKVAFGEGWEVENE